MVQLTADEEKEEPPAMGATTDVPVTDPGAGRPDALADAVPDELSGVVDATIASVVTAVERRFDAQPDWVHTALARTSLRALEADGESLGATSAALEEVGELFGLSHLDRSLLAVALLPELHPAAHLLAGCWPATRGRAVRRPPSPSSSSGARSSTRPAAKPCTPARRCSGRGCWSWSGDDVLPARRLRVPDRVVARLLGSHVAPEIVSRVLCDPRPVDVDGYREVAGALADGERSCGCRRRSAPPASGWRSPPAEPWT